jgi:HD-like signal output (HDOD) protein
MSDERKSYKEVAKLIALDPVLAGEVLRLANSGLYGRRFEVRSLLQAIALLGIGRINQLTITAALWRGLSRQATTFTRGWWRHNIAAALIAQRCNEDLSSGAAGDFAYTAGLLHGIGQLALYEDDPSDYPTLVEYACGDGADLLACEREVFGVDHAALSGFILESWGLPVPLCSAAAKHHVMGADTRLVRAVQTGCAGAESAGFGKCGCHQHLADGVPAPLAELFATDFTITALLDAVNQIECSLL